MKGIGIALLFAAAAFLVTYQACIGNYVTWTHKSQDSVVRAGAEPNKPRIFVSDEDGRRLDAASLSEEEMVLEPIDPNAGEVDVPADDPTDTVLTLSLPDPNEPQDIRYYDGTDTKIMGQWLNDKHKFNITDPNCLTDESIERLADSGRLCEVLGHQWMWTGGSITGESTTQEQRQTCELCGLREERRWVGGHWTKWEIRKDP